MRKLILSSTLLLALSASVIPHAGAEITYRSGEGWSSGDEDSGPVEKTASEQLHKAQDIENSGDTKKALAAYRALLRKFPNTGVAPEVQLKIAELDDRAGFSDKAFNEYGKYITRYPKGTDFEKAVEGQFNIGRKFLGGERREVFGVKTFPSMERAQQMFEDVIKNAPYSKFAALSQFNIGVALERQGKFPEAVEAYQKVIDNYPADDVSADAQYQIGYVYLKQAKDGSNDQADRNKARDAFEDFVMRFPQSEKVGQAKDNIKSLSGTDTKRELGVAQYYEKTKDYKAAVIYYEDVIKSSPGTPEAAIADKQIEGLKKRLGDDALRSGPERAENGEKEVQRRKLQAKVDTASRPDYNGPPAPVVPDEVAPAKPQLRTSTDNTAPLPATPEPSMPTAPDSNTPSMNLAPGTGLGQPTPQAPAVPPTPTN